MKMKRVFLKLSGEALAGPKKNGIEAVKPWQVRKRQALTRTR